MLAGCVPLVPAIFFMLVVSQMFSGPVDARDYYYFAVWLSWLAIASAVAYAAFRLGLRNREVVIEGKTLLIQWGSRMPLTLKRIDLSALADFKVTKEKRFAMNARSSGHYGYRNMPDRWRLTATVKGRTVDLGSYSTEGEAHRAVTNIQQEN